MAGRKRIIFSMLGAAAVLIVAGCDSALVVGHKVVGVESGRFYYTDGFLRTDYTFPMDQVWTAGKSTLTDLKALDLQEKKRIAKGTIECVVSDEKVYLEIEYASKRLTHVSVRTGTTGNQLASRMILDRIQQKLEATPPSERGE